MAINFPNGFIVTSPEPIDARLVLTKAEMKSQVDARMPSTYFAVCKEDGKLYVYDIKNEIDEELGRFRLYETDVSVQDLSVKLPDALAELLSKQEVNSGLEVDENGNVRVNLDSDYLTINDDNSITFAEDLIISGN